MLKQEDALPDIYESMNGEDVLGQHVNGKDVTEQHTNEHNLLLTWRYEQSEVYFVCYQLISLYITRCRQYTICYSVVRHKFIDN